MISVIKNQIAEKTIQSNHLRKQLSQLQQEIDVLRNQFSQLELEEFVNYLQINESIEVENYYSFKGVCTDPKSNNSFMTGECFKIVKKNKDKSKSNNNNQHKVGHSRKRQHSQIHILEDLKQNLTRPLKQTNNCYQ